MAATGGDRSSGFTLLEILVAMTLLGLVVAMVFGGLRLGVRVWETADERADERARIAVVQRFVGDTLARAYPVVESDRRNVRQIAFLGEGARLELIALMPENLSAGGFNHIVLEVVDDAQNRQLVLRYGPRVRDDDDPSRLAGAEGAEGYVLIEGIARATFSYYGETRDGEDAAWLDEWRDAELLPALVRLDVEFPAGDRRVWPELVVAPMASVGAAGDAARAGGERP
jgi:general secretion pathway protein J